MARRRRALQLVLLRLCAGKRLGRASITPCWMPQAKRLRPNASMVMAVCAVHMAVGNFFAAGGANLQHRGGKARRAHEDDSQAVWRF